MAAMSSGFSETVALDIFNELKRALADQLLDASWNILSDEKKLEFATIYSSLKHADIYTQSGMAFSPEHKELLLSLSRFNVSGHARGVGNIILRID
jgi:hypothetical protein